MEEAHKSFRVQILRQKTEIQYTEYHATNRGKYDWHHDVDWNNPSGLDRKLSVTVQLSDPSEYEGGDFQFMEVEQPSEEAKTKGTILMFPSYLQHRVTPVTDGVRKSLVLWFTGPRWQ
jgi:PKHD-type hydroxylase